MIYCKLQFIAIPLELEVWYGHDPSVVDEDVHPARLFKNGLCSISYALQRNLVHLNQLYLIGFQDASKRGFRLVQIPGSQVRVAPVASRAQTVSTPMPENTSVTTATFHLSLPSNPIILDYL